MQQQEFLYIFIFFPRKKMRQIFLYGIEINVKKERDSDSRFIGWQNDYIPLTEYAL